MLYNEDVNKLNQGGKWMPPMDHARHEEILVKLNNPELSHTERGELLTELRNDYVTVITNHQTQLTSIEKLDKQNKDLVQHSASLFMQLGQQSNTDPKPKEEEEKVFSETVSLTQLMKGANK